MKAGQFEAAFVALWCFVMPVTSFSFMPSVQGTVPAYVMGFLSVGLIFLRGGPEADLQRKRYLISVAAIFALWLLLFCGSQLGHLVSGRHGFSLMTMIDRTNQVVLRPSLFTQSLYFASCVLIALYFRYFFRPEFMRYVFWGAWLLALYGIYEWTYFLIFKHPGDFIVNRVFKDARIGSWSQAISVGPLLLLRIKSTLGEPAFFAAAVLPYLVLANAKKQNWLALALLFCTVFSTSTTAYLGLFFAFGLLLFLTGRLTTNALILFVLAASAFATLVFVFPDTYYSLFGGKFSGETASGEARWQEFHSLLDLLSGFSLMNWLFGVGFGYIYSRVAIIILVDTGILGFIIYTMVFLKPVWQLKSGDLVVGLRVAMATVFFVYFINVPELFLPPTWMFLGLAYWALDRQREEESLAACPAAEVSQEHRL